MAITLHPDQEAWLETRVASGDFASVEAAARQLLGERIAELARGEDRAYDEAWMKPYIDEGLAALDRGEFVCLKSTGRTTRDCLRPSRLDGAGCRLDRRAGRHRRDLLRDLTAKAGLGVAADTRLLLRRFTTDWPSILIAARRGPPTGGMFDIGLVRPYVVAYRHVPDSDLVGVIRVFTAAAASRADCWLARPDLQLCPRLELARKTP